MNRKKETTLKNTEKQLQQTRWGEKPYYSLDYYLKETFGHKVYKLALDGGMTCPNRDGVLGSGGCIFCSEGGSGDFAEGSAACVSEGCRPAALQRVSPALSDNDIEQRIALLDVHGQIERAKKLVSAKIKDGKYIAYFQSYTNTYGPLPYLEALFSQAVSHPDIIALSIGTRPDCLSEETIALLKRLNQKKPIWIELGLQTIHEDSARLIRRGYELPCFLDALKRLKEAGLTVIVHVILGLPGETREDMLETVRFLGQMSAPSIDGIKLQLLHVLKGTALCRLYEKEPFHVMEPEEYFSLIADCIRLLPKNIIIHRISGDGPKSLLKAPLWSGNKRFVLNSIAKTLRETGAFQGEWSNPSA
ncbi:MAG: TIGR01212 family radical SAM protein [Clostridium sp.]|nr:TIGR01212 family radical SAM protein [Clostridium sp.]